jgi:hypothetical protein
LIATSLMRVMGIFFLIVAVWKDEPDWAVISVGVLLVLDAILLLGISIGTRLAEIGEDYERS